MVYLSRIYTKSGDQGETGLGDGKRVPKDHARVAAYGSADELSSVLGLLLVQGLAAPEHVAIAALIRDIQNDLFDVGADLCLPELPVLTQPGSPVQPPLRVRADQVTKLEQAIDQHNADLQPLRSFILPGGTLAAAWCHLGRTVCRRAEREVVTLMRQETVNPQVVIYLNRLSDLLFVLARVCNDGGKGDVLWVPGGGTNRPGA